MLKKFNQTTQFLLLGLSAMSMLFLAVPKNVTITPSDSTTLLLTSLDTEKQLIPNHVSSCGCCLCRAAKLDNSLII